MKTYKVEIGFCGFIGASQIYEIDADSEEEARELALQEAIDDLSVDAVEEDEDDGEE